MDIKSYITGLVDGEGCFMVSFSLRSKMKHKIEVRPSFSLSQNKRSKEIIFLLQNYFACGGVRFSRKDQNYKYEVRSVKDLVKTIIPHFKKYPLKTAKKEEFEKFAEICQLIYSNQHLSLVGLIKIIKLSEHINVSGNKKYNRNDLLQMIAR